MRSRKVRLVCPACQDRLVRLAGDTLLCRGCGRDYPVVAGVPQLVLPETLDDAALDAVGEWDALAPDYRAFVEAVGARLDALDRPLLALAHAAPALARRGSRHGAAPLPDVLEVGCGDGRLLARVDRARVGALAGVDLAPSMAAAAHGRGLDVATAAAEHLPYPDASFDVVLSGFYSLRYADLDLALAELARVLRSGGRFAITLQGRRAADLGARLTGLGVMVGGPDRALGLRLALGREPGAVLPTDVSGLHALTASLSPHGLRLDRLFGTPYLPIAGRRLWRLARGRLPYLRGAAAAALARDLIVLGRRDRID